MHNYFHNSLVGGATFDPAIGQPDPLGTMASLATSNDPVFCCFIPIWIDSGLNGSQMGTQVAIIIYLVKTMEVSTTDCGPGTEVSPLRESGFRGMWYPYYPFCHQMILSQLQTLWISGSTATHMTRLVIRFCEAASIMYIGCGCRCYLAAVAPPKESCVIFSSKLKLIMPGATVRNILIAVLVSTGCLAI